MPDITTVLIIATSLLAVSGWGLFFFSIRKSRLFQLKTERIQAIDKAHYDLATHANLSIGPSWRLIAGIISDAHTKMHPQIPDMDLQSICSDGRPAAHHFEDAIEEIRKCLYVQYPRQTNECLWGYLRNSLIDVPSSPESLANHHFGINNNSAALTKRELSFVLEHRDGIALSAHKSWNAFKSWLHNIDDETITNEINEINILLTEGANHTIPLSENPKLEMKLKHTLWTLEHIKFLKMMGKGMELKYPHQNLSHLLFARYCLQLLNDKCKWGPNWGYYRGA